MFANSLQQLISSALTHLGDELPERLRLGRGLVLAEYLSAGESSDRRARVRALVHSLTLTYGGDEATLRSKLVRLGSLCSLFLDLYGDGPINMLRAPARINILGEHVDYVSYLPTASLPFGSREHDMIMLYRAADTGRVRGASVVGEYAPFDFELSDGPARGGQDHTGEWLSHLYQSPPPAPHWSNYVKGAAYFARVKHGERITRGFDFVVDSSIPPSGGASSSSALVVLAGAAVREANHVRAGAGELAADSSKAEWYVGTRGGSMDHLTICLARRSHAVLISYLEQRTRFIPLPGEHFRWAAFFSHPADKGREIMLEYNERAAISRVLIPAIIEGWSVTDPGRYEAWGRTVESLRSASAAAPAEAESLLGSLPETITLAQFEQIHPEAFGECARAFPALVAERRERALRVRAYALHHVGEVRRVAAAERLLGGHPTAEGGAGAAPEDAAPSVGALLDESHASLRDLYGVSTPDVEELLGTIRTDPHVYGARLMGGGFGGNVLALTTVENLDALAERVQAGFYGPRGRDGALEGSVMVSTPGDGLSPLGLEAAWRGAVEEFNALGPEAAGYRERLAEMLDEVTTDTAPGEVWPVIVAAGKGSRARESGLDVPKPLAAVAGVPAILRVTRAVRSAAGGARPPVVIVSPETESDVREALAGEDVIFVTQPEPFGTGDAVLHARHQLKEFAGRALVVWGTQPVIRPRTMARAIRLAALFDEFEMALPTALRERPYAPIERDGAGRVTASRETHLEKAPRAAFGETNIGLFVLKCPAMFEALSDLRRQYWRAAEGRYERPGGELGFPNEMINYLAARESGVVACPFADEREGQGIKTLEDVARCEQFLAELGGREG